MDDLACFGGDEVERAVGDLDEAIETDSGGSHFVGDIFLATGLWLIFLLFAEDGQLAKTRIEKQI